MDAASDLRPPISACSFDVPVQLSRKLRPIRCPIVPSSVRVSKKKNFLPKWMPLREFSFALVALASQFRAPARSGLNLFQPQPFAPKFPAHLPGCSDIPQQRSLTFRSPVLPPQCARAKIPSQMDAAPELQPSLSNAVFRSPCPSLLIQLVPLSASICTFHLLSFAPSCRGRSPYQACAGDRRCARLSRLQRIGTSN